MAPGAQIYIARALTVSDYRAVVDWFASVGVTVINRSLGSRYDGPGDGRGGIDGVAALRGRSAGIAWINSGRQRRRPAATTGNRFGLSGDRVGVRRRPGPTRSSSSTAVSSLGGVRWANDWDKPASQRTDYDVFIWDSPLGNPAAGTIVGELDRAPAQRRGTDREHRRAVLPVGADHRLVAVPRGAMARRRRHWRRARDPRLRRRGWRRTRRRPIGDDRHRRRRRGRRAGGGRDRPARQRHDRHATARRDRPTMVASHPT